MLTPSKWGVWETQMLGHLDITCLGPGVHDVHTLLNRSRDYLQFTLAGGWTLPLRSN